MEARNRLSKHRRSPRSRLALEGVHYENLKEATEHIEQEARMVLPGIQALFGFQLVAVFDNRFLALTTTEQKLHWLALALTSLSTVLTMAPAAYHRQAEPGRITYAFVIRASRWLWQGMTALAAGICIDFYLIGRLIFQSRLFSGIAAFFLLGLFRFYWSHFSDGWEQPGG